MLVELVHPAQSWECGAGSALDSGANAGGAGASKSELGATLRRLFSYAEKTDNLYSDPALSLEIESKGTWYAETAGNPSNDPALSQEIAGRVSW
eukprot:gene3069-13088_t